MFCKKISSVFLRSFLLSTFLFYSRFVAAQDQLLGNYQTPDKDGKVEFIKRGNRYFGKLTQSAHPKKDVHNPNPAMHTTNLVGAEFIKDLVYKDKNSWEDGAIYDSRSGKTYSCDIVLLENGDIKIRGYLGFPLLGQSVIFYRIK
ncbi:MAG TPA: DUF2147 domain-containing protein [Cytophagaceae bacterium]|jgi:uncharacterized protein (DUF2147 family)|nr:DUF2147 domain-containing protein [Cytophagaceae bacterium]